MNDPHQRRSFLKHAGLIALLAVPSASACRPTHPHQTSPTEKPVTITHPFGVTTIPMPPHKIACIGYTGQDDVLALGAIPIAITQWFGDQPHAIWPWETQALGQTQPTILTIDSGIPIEKIAHLAPDLIIATNAGVDKTTYQELSAIAPTIPQTTSDAFFEPWKIQASAIAQALYQTEKMTELLATIDQRFLTISKEYPQFKQYRIALFSGQLERGYATRITDWHSDFLSDMGFILAQTPPVVPLEQFPKLYNDLDAIIWLTTTTDEHHTLSSHPIIKTLKHNLFPSIELSAAIIIASPLSYLFLADHFPSFLADNLISSSR